MMRRAVLMVLLLGGCEQIDPFTRPGAWRPGGANEANLRTHVADPSTLDRGIEDWRSDGAVTAAAVQRYRTDRVKPLAASGVARIQATGAGGAAATGSGGGDGGR
jgi:hypothetical protein